MTQKEIKKMKRIENLQYWVLVLLIVGQCTVGENFYIGQFVYLAANVISVSRSFALGRPAADKIKDVCCLAITMGLLAFNFLK